jgi:hypothetical protein
MLRLRVSLPALMQLLGHKDIRMTLRYVEVTQLDLQREFHTANQRAASPHRDGERDPWELAAWVESGVKATPEDIAKSMDGKLARGIIVRAAAARRALIRRRSTTATCS